MKPQDLRQHLTCRDRPSLNMNEKGFGFQCLVFVRSQTREADVVCVSEFKCCQMFNERLGCTETAESTFPPQQKNQSQRNESQLHSEEFDPLPRKHKHHMQLGETGLWQFTCKVNNSPEPHIPTSVDCSDHKCPAGVQQVSNVTWK